MELMDQKERRGMNIKGFMKKNWLLIATVIAVVLGMYGDLHTHDRRPLCMWRIVDCPHPLLCLDVQRTPVVLVCYRLVMRVFSAVSVHYRNRLIHAFVCPFIGMSIPHKPGESLSSAGVFYRRCMLG